MLASWHQKKPKRILIVFSSAKILDGWNFPLSILLLFQMTSSCPTQLLLVVAGVGEGASLCGLPPADGHVLRSVCSGAAAGVSQRAAAVPTQLDGSPEAPAHFESRCGLL